MVDPRINVYLDIDGVLLANDRFASLYVHEFLEYVTQNFDVYWLTTHCRGDARHAVEHLARILPEETVALLHNIQPTDWDTWKTEAIDFSRPFLWFDDDLFESEWKELTKHDVFENWIQVDLGKDENQLKTLIDNFPAPKDTSNTVVYEAPIQTNDQGESYSVIPASVLRDSLLMGKNLSIHPSEDDEE